MISHSKGFTFLEILVVLILISLASSLVALNVGKSSGQKRTVFFIKKVQSLCVKARQRAMINGYPQSFVISSSERSCWIIPENKVEIPESITIEGENLKIVEEDMYVIRFYPDGSSSGGILFFKIDEVTRFRLKVDVLTGIIELINDQD